MEWTGFTFEPYFPWSVIGFIGFITLCVLVVSFIKSTRGILLRTLFFASALLLLSNPILIKEEKIFLNDQIIILVDNTESQNVGNRKLQNEEAISEILKAYGNEPDIDIHQVEITPEMSTEGTKILETLSNTIATIPEAQLAGVFIVSDGIIHENVNLGLLPPISAPIHNLITGSRNFIDRRISLVQAPEFAIVNRPVDLILKIEDFGIQNNKIAYIKAHRDGKLIYEGNIKAGSPRPISIEPIKRGEMIIDIEVSPLAGETSLKNNHIIHSVNAIQDRLRVLLVSGEPHSGERVWRTILKSDPAVDLIHFTILRLPTSLDATPVEEMALIPFPTEELFQNSLDAFDLVIFDRYTLRGVLPMQYLENLTLYVQEGGAILISAGPEFAAPFSLSSTPLGRILPLRPLGKITEEGFKPKVTEFGQKHPVTQGLNSGYEKGWGRWFRLIETQNITGDTLMEGQNGSPLLNLSRYGEGRIAVLTSDQIWMWAKGVDGGGPHRELLRRTIHWLMKEPDLEEKQLIATSEGLTLKIERRDLTEDEVDVNITGPENYENQITLNYLEGGVSIGEVILPTTGLYKVSYGNLSTLVGVGSSNRLEFSNLQPLDQKLLPLSEATGGAVKWISDGMPRFRIINENSNTSGRGWVGIKNRGASQTLNLQQNSLIDPFSGLLLLLFTLMLAWWRESH
ncbi:MAG: hypothetical protein ACKVIX_02970 [Sphingomonadales bacterium]